MIGTDDEMPKRYELDPNDERTKLRGWLVEALKALPHYFTSPINIEGLVATDLFSLNTLLGGAIEEQTVRILNSLRNLWDPDDYYPGYAFYRYPESFPDVRLVRSVADPNPVIGIELKGWYLLSKEKEPSFRYKASVDAVTPYDLIACVPWALSNVLSGQPAVYAPFVEQAKYASDMRTYYWQHRKGNSKGRNNEIIHPITEPYPKAGTEYVDSPVADRGGNFGRISRVEGLMTDWVGETLETPLAGIEAKYWISFFKAFTEAKSQEDIEAEMARIERAIIGRHKDMAEDKRAELLEHLYALVMMIGTE